MTTLQPQISKERIIRSYSLINEGEERKAGEWNFICEWPQGIRGRSQTKIKGSAENEF